MIKKVFIDGGSNLGQSVRKFRQIYDVQNEYIYYMFEPNKKMYDTFFLNTEFNDCFKYNIALSNKNEKDVKLWGGDNSHSSIECGATINSSKKITDRFQENEYILVDTIMLSDFIKQNFKNEEEITLKLDIEAAEYDVFEDLINTGVINRISKVYCEFHTDKLKHLDYLSYKEREENIKKELKKINLYPEYWDAL